MKIVSIGAGSLAWCMSLEMQRAGMTISQVYSRTRKHAELLAKKLNCRWTTNPVEIMDDADLYIFSLKDSVLYDMIRRVKPNSGLWVHTSGIMPVDVFAGHVERYGVFYPFQTFTKGRRFRLDNTPVFLEANSANDLKMLRKIAIALTGHAFELSSEKRRQIHSAAIFASDFANYMYLTASKLLEEHGLPYTLLLPLIGETAERLCNSTPLSVQADTVSRFENCKPEDLPVMPDDPVVQNIYHFISHHIHEEKMKNEKNEKNEKEEKNE
ncbi:MAG: DUF2520 domain-containing protein [Bacteroidales bacterium]|jgi:predicted short-subunit dehydrogenase-like oxidoreductase (DUF2520 family)|nr:DUF2520 domain-containing protein [Bacteroidales bacterium]